MVINAICSISASPYRIYRRQQSVALVRRRASAPTDATVAARGRRAPHATHRECRRCRIEHAGLAVCRSPRVSAIHRSLFARRPASRVLLAGERSPAALHRGRDLRNTIWPMSPSSGTPAMNWRHDIGRRSSSAPRVAFTGRAHRHHRDEGATGARSVAGGTSMNTPWKSNAANVSDPSICGNAFPPVRNTTLSGSSQLEPLPDGRVARGGAQRARSVVSKLGGGLRRGFPLRAR